MVGVDALIDDDDACERQADTSADKCWCNCDRYEIAGSILVFKVFQTPFR